MTKAKQPGFGAGSHLGKFNSSPIGRIKNDSLHPPDPIRPVITLEPSLPALLSVEATAKQLSASTKTVRRLIQRGALRCCRVGRLVRIRAVDLARFVASGTGS